MKIEKGQLVRVNHCRKGTFFAIAERAFDTKKEEWYPFVVVQKVVRGLNTDWIEGDKVPCRGEFCEIGVLSRG